MACRGQLARGEASKLGLPGTAELEERTCQNWRHLSRFRRSQALIVWSLSATIAGAFHGQARLAYSGLTLPGMLACY